jgi:hypothetical protein
MMGLFHKQSRWEKLIEPVSHGAPAGAAKSGLTALGAFIGISLASAAVSAVRQRRERT